MIVFALLLAVGLTLVETELHVQKRNKWTYSVRCFNCMTTNTFRCPAIRTCPYETRRCMVISIRVDLRTVLVYKNCTDNCTFVYASQQPPPTPKASPSPNSYYFVHCCNGVECNGGGPSNVERDILPDTPIEEELSVGIEHWGNTNCLLIFTSIVLSNALT